MQAPEIVGGFKIDEAAERASAIAKPLTFWKIVQAVLVGNLITGAVVWILYSAFISR